MPRIIVAGEWLIVAEIFCPGEVHARTGGDSLRREGGLGCAKCMAEGSSPKKSDFQMPVYRGRPLNFDSAEKPLEKKRVNA
jgi:hypothetical protein